MNWPIPPFDSQVSLSNHVDVLDCTCESLTHILYSMTGVHYSPRALAIAAKVNIEANRTVENVLTVANTFGLIRYEHCPSPDTFTWDSYYNFDISNFPTEKLDISLIPLDYDLSPSWTQLEFGSTTSFPVYHLVEQPNPTEYYDSEPNDEVKPITYNQAVVKWQSSIKINHPPMNTNVKLVKNGQEYGFYVPATTEATLIDKALNFAYPLPTLNNGQNVDWANLKPDLTIS